MFRKFPYQVAGHQQLIQYYDDDRVVLKPAIDREVQFYEKIKDRPELATLAPRYCGMVTIISIHQLAHM